MALKVVFMGTPYFAERILHHLLGSTHEVVAVVTVADKPAGRGQQLKESDVKITAKEHNVPVLQPTSLKDLAFLETLKQFKADLFVVVAFRMLPKEVWQMPRLGTFNLHASLLPQYRGAAPINWAIINGEKQSGVTTFFINEEIDAGNLLMQQEITIQAGWDAGTLHDELIVVGKDLVVETLNQIEKESLTAQPQVFPSNAPLLAAPKLTKANTKLLFERKAIQLQQLVRGLHPYPSAHCQLKNTSKNTLVNFKIHQAHATEIPSDDKTALKPDPSGILFPCADCYLCVTELQPEGKRKMDFKAFVAGNPLSTWEIVL